MSKKQSIKEQIIDNKINDIAEYYNIDKDEAFARFCYSIFTNTDFEDNNYELDDIDGSHEHQIDSINVENLDFKSAIINIFQFKNKTSFESSIIKQMKYGIEFILEASKNDILKNPNKSFVEKVLETREIRKNIHDINIIINVFYITLGDETKVSKEYEDVKENIVNTYNIGIFDRFNFYTIGVNKIIERMNSIEISRNNINENMSFIMNSSAAFIQYLVTDVKGVLLTVHGKEIARIVDKYYPYIFDQNVRNYLGTENSINKDIYTSCTGTDLSKSFWFLNNGITIVCDMFSLNTDPDSPSITLKGMQIINGCQTSMVLRKAYLDGCLNEKVNLIARVIQTTNQDIISSIVRATNSQTKITLRDLHSNDPIQKQMEIALSTYNICYQRKVNPIPKMSKKNENIDVINETIAQSFLAIFLKRPSKARNSKSILWSDDLYTKIFDGGNIERYVISYILYSTANEYIRKSVKNDRIKYYKEVGRYVTFHISRITAYLINKGDQWPTTENQKKIIQDLKNNIIDIKSYFKKSFDIINDIIKDKGIDKVDIVNYTKKDDFDDAINAYLYTNIK